GAQPPGDRWRGATPPYAVHPWIKRRPVAGLDRRHVALLLARERPYADRIGGPCQTCCWSMRGGGAPPPGGGLNASRAAPLGKGLRRPWIFAEFSSEMS